MRRSSIPLTNDNFPSASNQPSPATTTVVTAAVAADFSPPTVTSVISLASDTVVPSVTIPTVISTESARVIIATNAVPEIAAVTVPSLVLNHDNYSTGITPASIVPRAFATQDIPFINLNDFNLQYAENNESIDELMNFLSGNQQEQNADIPVNQRHHLTPHAGPNRQRHNRLITVEDAEELETNLARRAIFLIVEKYFNSRALALSITDRLFELGIEDSLTFTALLSPITSKSRPGKPAQLLMIEELIGSNIFIINRGKSNSIIITKNPNYHH